MKTLLIGVLAAAEALAQASPEGYVGTETCVTCHEDIGRAFQRNPHAAVGSARAWKGRACESCHGPGKEHVKAAAPQQIFVFKTAEPAKANDRCLTCHSGDQTHDARLFGSHNRNQIRCTECHAVHHASVRPLLAAPTNELCTACHWSVQAEFRRPYRHKLLEGAMSCVDCHNPHGDLPQRDLRRVAANDIGCLKCHSDKRGPFPFEHAPVRFAACSTCHEPHGSANPRMLTRPNVSLLCLECHTTTTLRTGSTPPAFHDLRSARFQNCTICHTRIHGSFASQELLR